MKRSADLAEEFGGHQRPHARQRQQRVADDSGGDLNLERTDLAAQRQQACQPLTGEAGLELGTAGECAASPGQLPDAHQPDGMLLVAGRQHQEVGVESIANPRRLADEVVTGLDQHLQLAAGVVNAHRRQIRLAQGDARDGQRVARIALAGAAGVDPLAARQLRRHLTHCQPARQQAAGEHGSIRGRAFDADQRTRSDAVSPGGQGAMSGRIVAELDRSAALVDGAGRQCRLVGIDANGRHGVHLLQRS